MLATTPLGAYDVIGLVVCNAVIKSSLHKHTSKVDVKLYTTYHLTAIVV